MTIAISGASGFVGQALRKHFEAKNHKVLAISRQIIQDENALTEVIAKADVIVNLAGANIATRWSEVYKKELYESRIETTRKIVSAINITKHRPLLISTSAIGIYPNDIPCDEMTLPLAETFLANLCKDWESEAQKAETDVCIFRFSVILGEGGALKKMLPAFKLGLGGVLGSGTQAFSSIHIDDLLSAYDFVIDQKELKGIFNIASPEATTNSDFTKTLGKILHRPTFLHLPQWLLKVLFAEGVVLLTEGQHVTPKALLNAGFSFKYMNAKEALEHLL